MSNNKKINVVLVEANGSKLHASMSTIEDNIDTFYKILDCRCIDIQVRFINGKPYNFIFDDEFLYTKAPYVERATMVCIDAYELLYGNIIICPINEDDSSELGSFSIDEQKNISSYLNDMYKKIWNMFYTIRGDE